MEDLIIKIFTNGETIAHIILGIILPQIIFLGKRLGVSPKQTYALVACAVAIPYVLIDILTPIEFKTQLTHILGTMFSVSFIVYEYLLKKPTT